MKRKQIQYEKALILRRTGKSLKQIAKSLNVSVSITSLWCREVELTEAQKTKLSKRKTRVQHLRRLARQSHLEKVSRVRKLFKDAYTEIKPLNEQELFLIGVALYWAEGFKSIKEGRLGFCNSDPKMIKFMMKWFQKALKISKENFLLRTEFNESHKNRLIEIQSFWSKVTKIPLTQFEKPFYHYSTWLKEYSNHNTYFGVLRIRVRKSSELLNKMRGWIKGLSYNATLKKP